MVARLDHKRHTDRDHHIEDKQDDDINIGAVAKVSVEPSEATTNKTKEVND